jgi:dTDP-4-dehydrorhamnose 3,5-epimerase
MMRGSTRPACESKEDPMPVAPPSVSFAVVQSAIPGALIVTPQVRPDHRGFLVKTFHGPSFEELGIKLPLGEEFYTASSRGVLRGMHVLAPPGQVTKLVYCAHGEVMDVILDLRAGSPAYGKHEINILSGEKGDILLIPEGVAHGFYTTSESSIMIYKMTGPYSPECDRGVRWNSAGIPWPDKNPILSERDRNLPGLDSFKSPFTYGGHP